MTALEFLRADQRASGLTVREYEAKYGVLLSPPGSTRPMGRAADIAKHEVQMSETSHTIGHEAHCPACASGLTARRDNQ